MGDNKFEIKKGYRELFSALIERYGPDPRKTNTWDGVLNMAERHLEAFDVAGYYIELSKGAALSMASGDTSRIDDKYFHGAREVFGLTDVNAMISMTYKLYGEMLSYDDAGIGEMAARIGIFQALLDTLVSGLMKKMSVVMLEAYREGNVSRGELYDGVNIMIDLAMDAKSSAIEFIKKGKSVESDEDSIDKAVYRTQELFSALVVKAARSVDEFLEENNAEEIVGEEKKILVILKVWSFILTMGNNGYTSLELMEKATKTLHDIGLPSGFLRQIVETGSPDDEDEIEVQNVGVATAGSEEAKQIIDDFGAIDMQALMDAIDKMVDDDD